MRIRTAEWTIAGRRLAVTAASVVGNRYRDNYDVLHVGAERPIAVVADGMGDGPGSAAAGRTAVEVFVRESGTTVTGPAALRAAVAAVQVAVREAGSAQPGLTGCTLTALVGGDHGDAWIVQLGDSRAYRLRDGVFELLTSDHTAAWLGILNGWYPPGSREASYDRHRLTRYAGHPGMPEPDLLNVSLRPGDLLFLCTDGVSDQIDDRALARLLADGAPVETVLDQTLANGGDDNATAALISVR